MKTSTVKPHLKWDGFREQYQGIIKNLINNIDICNEGFAKTGDEGYMAARKKYIEEVEQLKTFIKEKEIELGYYGDENED
jgi:hypothetical protein